MIKNIKIFGERNSGTNFLSQLITKNISGINLCNHHYKCKTGWKHGFPKLNRFKNLNQTLFVFIIRDLESWVKSMYNNPYSYKRPTNINRFITKTLPINDHRKDHDVNINKAEKQNVIKLRYAKIKHYKMFFERVPNAIFINLKDLQENNNKFLQFLKKTYSLNVSNNICKILSHTKNSNIKNKNRSYNTVLPPINNKDVEIEQMVNNLKTEYCYKSNLIQECKELTQI